MGGSCAAEPGGRDREVNRREGLHDILYLVRGGVSWRLLPHDLPPWGTVHYYSRCFRLDGINPSAGIMDSQSVKTTKKGDLAAATMLANT